MRRLLPRAAVFDFTSGGIDENGPDAPGNCLVVEWLGFVLEIALCRLRDSRPR